MAAACRRSSGSMNGSWRETNRGTNSETRTAMCRHVATGTNGFLNETFSMPDYLTRQIPGARRSRLRVTAAHSGAVRLGLEGDR